MDGSRATDEAGTLYDNGLNGRETHDICHGGTAVGSRVGTDETEEL